MPDVEPLRFPSREGRPNQQDQADLQAVCSGRRRTCALLNSPSPSVNQAIYHIQELKMKVENWCQQSGKYQPHINQDKHQYSETLRFQSRDSDTEPVMSTKLFVEGIAISTRESCPLSPLLKKINDVLGEVVYLIERLEADRQYAEEGLHKEKRRKRFLESKVDCISLWKQQEHSFVVQKEHEACIRDITELKWQLKLEREKLDQVQEKLSHAEILNQHLHEDISFAKKQIPIVRENLEIQRGIINQINTVQAEADKVHSKTQNDLTLVERESKKMQLDANNEKKSLDHVLLAMKNQLANRLEDLNKLKMFENELCAEIKDAEKMIALTEEQCAAITQRIPEIMELEKAEKDRISQLKFQIEGEMQKSKKLKEKLIALQEDIEKTKLNGEAEVSCVEEQLLSKRNAFAALRKENMEYEQNLEDYKIKISESEKAVKQMREERKQMLQKIIDNDEHWERAREEVTKVVAQHSVTQTKLEEQEQLTFMEEQRARKEIENLRKDLTGQMTALEVLKSQCANVSDELHRQQRSSELANKKLQNEYENVSSTTKALETQIEKMKNLTEHFEKVQSEHNNILANLEREKKLKCDHLKAAQDLHTATIKRYDITLSRTNDLTKKCEEYRNASDKMDKIVESMPDVIAELQSALEVVEFKDKSAALIMSTLQSDINNCLQRTQRSMQTHTAHVTAREKEMEDTKGALIIALKENKQLASEYEGLKKILMEAKQEAVSALTKKNHAHKSFQYYTQLSLLQKRMHKALVKYFKQRSLYSQAELDRCQSLSQETDQKIKTAQEGLSEEIQLISAFLQSLTDDSATTDDAGVNKQASPDAAGSNE
ncbi:coiled-coil domain-containing protein 178 [Thunnus albacares]|uniref:coiled-coil domain-containing protein 178 n=1 Tax=Thunnus albacares TaxID=8236 RepID=UPI001CF670CC|nr:coiled-coil domain-containing protein 178 [Thunnus albacares]XP_044224585.1 coiled-coil domain-containing protein 178 [Thunnus albacares]XP_044224586.1 coiled-coil domain-containing protein 178 [Thunnus albacares]